MRALEHFRRHDWWLYASFFVLSCAGLLTARSAAPSLFWYQSAWVLTGTAIIIGFSFIDWRPLINYRWVLFVLYIVPVLLLLGNLFFSPTIRQTKSWLVIGPLRFQTAELAKLSLIIIFSYFFARHHVGIAHMKNIFRSFFYFAVPASLILLQPDWGTTFIVFGLWVGYLLVSGIRLRHAAIGLLLCGLLAGFLWQFGLQGYQRARIIGFLEPSYDPVGVNYSVIQSKIAIGSAGFLGKGFGQGTQVQLRFLTEPATDFVLAAWIEEWGVLGGLFVIASFGLLLFRILRIGALSENNFTRLLCLGTVMLFLLQFLFNVGSTLGLLPVVGVTFPFFSYGGSSFLTKAVLLGIIQSIRTHA